MYVYTHTHTHTYTHTYTYTYMELPQIVFRVGGFEAATALYRDVFEAALRPLQDASDASNADDESPSFYKWHARTLRAEFLGWLVQKYKY